MDLIRVCQGGDETDLVLGPRVADHGWGLGYMLNQRRVNGPNPRIFGHGGLGGSFGFVDLEHRIGYAYVANRFDATKSNADPRSLALSNEVYAALGVAEGLTLGSGMPTGRRRRPPAGQIPAGHIQAAHSPAVQDPRTPTGWSTAPVVAAVPVPVVAPAWVPELTRAPLREGAWLRLSVGGDTDTGQPQDSGSREDRCSKTRNDFHGAGYPIQRCEKHRECRLPVSL